MASIRYEIVHHIFRLNFNKFDQQELERERTRELEGMKMQGAPEPGTAPAQQIKSGPVIGRNDDCHCGSGKKYKKCHGK